MTASVRQHFSLRRQQLAAKLDDGILILATAQQQTRNADTHYNYRWDSNFHYLTGFKEPNAILLMKIQDGRATTTLFCQPKDLEREIWDGIRLGPEAAVSELGVDEAFSINEFSSRLPQYLVNQSTIYSLWGEKTPTEELIFNAVNHVKSMIRQGVNAPYRFMDVRSVIHEMRLIKDEVEIAIMRQAARIASTAHNRAMRSVKNAQYEYEVEAELLYEFKKYGSDAPAYPSIVAAGENATILHYVENNATVKSGQLMLIDAGCEWQGYASDITRTFPVNGKFTDTQKLLYDIVLRAQLAAIESIKPGIQFNDYHLIAVRSLVEGLVDLKLCQGSIDGIIESGDYRRFYMHRTGHWLGRDVHDVGEYMINGQSRYLEPGMVMTVEPGLYIRPDSSVPEQFHGIGIRIEDDILVTHNGVDVLTKDAYKTVVDIESWMNQ
ncbi:Xaa-Pro aminopeptidase [Ferrovum sp. PN-J185]|uniref:Xaa-Pro aminopeptidase n=1 Tax=Ferrovum sp. PN-J185 TaxID=1356306 RepID=UPI001E3F3044|nr:Xaa-Pro aminopeptidase [Ferrovum sp. PN-J185]MCC6067944.1 Xaa-Pro aminopeptidase [Ferrovum sp. PN-J185]MDE1891287.1 Xaa-Pro aminopeptidase [Betaproteobacteria bacterium]MDE2056327.1 Xaa-Pro aminopeptidase [Betaproteobacteria bacterium]